MGHSEEAISAHERSIALYQEAAYMPGLERAYSNLGCVYSDLSRWDEALRYFQEAAELSDRTGEEWRRAAAAINLGEIYRKQGELGRAIDVYDQARQIGETFGFEEVVGMALMNLGASYLKKGELAQARGYLEEALDIFKRIGTDVYLPEVLCYLAQLQVIRGQPDEALRLAQEALDRASKLGRRIEEGQARRTLGQAYRKLGQFAEADVQLGESLAILEAQNSPYEVGLTLVEHALLRKAQDPAVALVCASESAVV
jgi:tetratricopeptide (TPR) repeat protein